jgi:hypothetical protein
MVFPSRGLSFNLFYITVLCENSTQPFQNSAFAKNFCGNLVMLANIIVVCKSKLSTSACLSHFLNYRFPIEN